MAGNFDATLPTPAQVKTLTDFLVQKSKQYLITADNVFPHRHFAQKTCYGDKLSDTWAADLLRNSVGIVPPVVAPVLTQAQWIVKAMDLIARIKAFLKGAK